MANDSLINDSLTTDDDVQRKRETARTKALLSEQMSVQHFLLVVTPTAGNSFHVAFVSSPSNADVVVQGGGLRLGTSVSGYELRCEMEQAAEHTHTHDTVQLFIRRNIRTLNLEDFTAGHWVWRLQVQHDSF